MNDSIQTDTIDLSTALPSNAFARPGKTDIPEPIFAEWQHIVDIMAELIKVPVALITRIVGDNLQILVASQTPNNPYTIGDTHLLYNSGLFCEAVINGNTELLVPNALSDPLWEHTPDLKLNLVSYLGLPILWPNNKIFGTLCVLDHKPNGYSDLCQRLMTQFRDLIEHHLVLIFTETERQRHASASRERHDEALRTNEDRFFRVLEFAHVPMMVATSEDLHVININNAFATVSGFNLDDVIGHTATSLELFASPHAHRKIEQVLQKNADALNFEIQIRRKNGTLLDCVLSVETAIVQEQYCILLVFHDITEHKKSEHELIKAIEAVMHDASWFSHAIVEKLVNLRWSHVSTRKRVELNEFTPREREVLGLMCEGLDDTEIADYLELSRNTVRNHVATIYNKLDVHRRSAVIVWARERGITKHERSTSQEKQ